MHSKEFFNYFCTYPFSTISVHPVLYVGTESEILLLIVAKATNMYLNREENKLSTNLITSQSKLSTEPVREYKDGETNVYTRMVCKWDI